MAIKPELDYNIKNDMANTTIYGFSDFGELGRRATVASKEMVFTLRGLNKNWKQTTSYYIGCPKGDDIAEILKLTISKTLECGLQVIAVCCDQGSNNRRAYKLLGTTETKPFFEIKNQQIFSFI